MKKKGISEQPRQINLNDALIASTDVLKNSVIQLNEENVIDLRALFYQTEPNKRKHSQVDLNSFVKGREKLVLAFVEYLNVLMNRDKSTSSSIMLSISLARTFAFYCNDEGLLSTYNLQDCQLALASYIESIKIAVQTKTLSYNQGLQRQCHAIRVVELGFKYKDVADDIDLLSSPKIRPTEISLNNALSASLDELRNSVIKIDDNHIIDLRAICYRTSLGRRRMDQVDPESYISGRETLILALSKYAYILTEQRKLTKNSVVAALSHARTFAFFCNDENLLTTYSKDDCRFSLNAYVLSISAKVARKELSYRKGKILEFYAKDALEVGFGYTDIMLNLALLKNYKKRTKEFGLNEALQATPSELRTIILMLDEHTKIDLRSICYQTNPLNRRYKANLDTYIEGREKLVLAVSKYANYQLNEKHLTNRSIKVMLTFARSFIFFCNDEGLLKSYSKEDCIHGLELYINFIKQKVQSEELSYKQGYQLQYNAIGVLDIGLGYKEIATTIDLLKPARLRTKQQKKTNLLKDGWVQREAVGINPSQPFSVMPEDLRNYGLALVEGSTTDLGIICYRNVSKGTKNRFIYEVDSLIQGREYLVEKLLRCAESLQGSLANTSIHSRLINIRYFIFFCNDNNLLEEYDWDDFRIALEEYLAFFREQLWLKKISNNTLQRYQYDAIYFLKEVLELEKIDLGINLFKKSKISIEHVEPPSEDNLAKTLSIAKSLFNTVSNAIKNETHFPLPIDVPKYLNRKNNKSWIFPLRTAWTAVSNDLKNYQVYDYESGTLVGVEEALSSGATLTRSQKIAYDLIEKNSNYDTSEWHWLARIGIYSFSILFAASTGMNKTQLMELQWHDNFVIDRDSQNFYVIKRRSDDKESIFRIQAEFKLVFDKYLEMRKKIIQRFGFTNYLFFSFSIHPPYRAQPLLDGFFKLAIGNIRRIDIDLQGITYQQLRASKAEWLLSNKDEHITSELLQNEIKTVQENYSKGSESKSQEQMSGFFEELSLKVQSEKNKNTIEIGIGSCNNFGHPIRVINTKSSVPSDCKKSEGCLMCNNYSIIADVKDIRKLLSCKYCIEATSHLSSSYQYFESLYGEVLQRIDYLLNAISDELGDSGELVKRITAEVYEDGNLDSYWEYKFEQLMELGVV